MQFFTTEMVFMHPPRTGTGNYTAPRRVRFGCRTMPSMIEAPECREPAPPMAIEAQTESGPAIEIGRAA